MKALFYIKTGIFFLLLLMLQACGQSKQSEYMPIKHVVEIKDMKFQPAELSVHKGDTVFWINHDIVTHDVTEKNRTWASPILNAGDSWEKVVTKSDDYFCSIHITMKGEIAVE